MGAMSDLKKEHEYTQKPPLFKKIFQAGSVEEEAMAAFMAKKKAEDMRDELRQIISFTRGTSAWQELINMEAQIRKDRQKAIYDQKERRRKAIEYSLLTVMLLILFATVAWFFWFIMKAKGMI